MMLAPKFLVSPSPMARLMRAVGRVLTAGLAAAAVAVPTARAEKADRLKPLNFAADNARVDEARQLNVLTGNVDITKGTMIVRAAKVEVKQNRDGSQFAVAFSGDRGRAYYKQKRDGVDEYVEGEAERIEYDGAADVVRFVGRATMRRLRGSTPTDEVAGQTITYNSASDVYNVAGGPSSAVPSGRVHGVLTPRPQPEASGASAPGGDR